MSNRKSNAAIDPNKTVPMPARKGPQAAPPMPANLAGEALSQGTLSGIGLGVPMPPPAIGRAWQGKSESEADRKRIELERQLAEAQAKIKAYESQIEAEAIAKAQAQANEERRLRAAYDAGERTRADFAAFAHALFNVVNESEHALSPADVYAKLAERKVAGFVWAKSVTEESTDQVGNVVKSTRIVETDGPGKGIVGMFRFADGLAADVEYESVSTILASLFHAGWIVKTGRGAKGADAVRYWRLGL